MECIEILSFGAEDRCLHKWFSSLSHILDKLSLVMSLLMSLCAVRFPPRCLG